MIEFMGILIGFLAMGLFQGLSQCPLGRRALVESFRSEGFSLPLSVNLDKNFRPSSNFMQFLQIGWKSSGFYSSSNLIVCYLGVLRRNAKI
jgi:hypothetical protein